MKRKFFSILIALVLVTSFSLVTAVPAGALGPTTLSVIPFELGASDNAAAEWSTMDWLGGSSSVHLWTYGQEGDGNEARISIAASDVGIATLGDIASISWYECLVAGYPPHIDVRIDTDGDEVADDALVFEYAYNWESHSTEGAPTYGAKTGVWYQTFSDDGDGPAVIDDSANAWLGSGPPGPLGDSGFIYGTLAEWKAGTVDASVDNATAVLALEIELDNWIVQTEAYVDDIDVNGTIYYGQIQDAVDYAAGGDTISVAAGTYAENIIIYKSLVVEGANHGFNAVAEERGPESIINAQGVPIAVLINGAETVATFDGFMVDNYDTIGVLAGAFKDTVQEVPLGDDPVEVHIVNNIVKPPTIAPPHNNNIQVGAGTTGTIIGNEVSGALLESPDWSGSGILVAGSSNVVISNNYVHNSESGIVILGYMYKDPDAPAVDNLVENNLVENCEAGISIEALVVDTTVENNQVTNNSETGIQVYAYDDLWGLETSAPTGTKIHFNSIVGNGEGVASGVWAGANPTGITAEVDATTNWWGDISGPGQAATNPRGEGDQVSAYVYCEPWLTRDFQTVLDDNIAYFGYAWVNLNTGWNLMSTPIALDPGCDTWGEYVALGDPDLQIHGTSPAYSFNANTQAYEALIANSPLKPCDAILVRMAEPDRAPVLFSPLPSAPAKEVGQGWNLVGLASLEDLPVQEALTSLYQVAGDQTGYSMVVSPPLNQAPWTHIRDGEPQTLEKTRGYWVFMENGPDTLAGFAFTPMSLYVPPPPAPPGIVTEVAFQWYPVTLGSATHHQQDDDDSFDYALPWTFPFAGKEIVAIEVSSNGLIDLLEAGEISEVTSSYDYMRGMVESYSDSDIIFAWHDDLSSSYYGFYGVEYDAVGDVVVVHWETETFDDCDEGLLNYFQVWLFPDGSIQWNFKEFNYQEYKHDLGTGIYDSTSAFLLDVAAAMGEPDGIFNTPEKSYEISGEYLPYSGGTPR